ncbi:transcription factor HIVEP2a [Scyliorhinus canicula]|uniref:transcription factor HIVEP2a n=1 Tax=Scyliorhinus canicula TaxID=7830 RepID=UPI0018F557BF|nr:transcription factor HIVEP2a [Scyliorhinus canicula]XP_038672632.1 transcription factor HIVEP2a [Scyliorhinus canicula]XP_038672640.1 transcription factor HIVEP2a [Scyliorhinus canicula]XP_038672648.1 transcription factor HIVEP2a [Scyliorhinus canicula]XP_038672656.1 transcription factor HIVEP2a [Scyliorhinus canicula]XP_038672665.1 transcription factor HIVEP2a [Scyliorhinus canicula]
MEMEPKRATLSTAEDTGPAGQGSRDLTPMQPDTFSEQVGQRLAADSSQVGSMGPMQPYYPPKLQLPAEAPQQQRPRQHRHLLGNPYHHYAHSFPHFPHQAGLPGYPPTSTPELGSEGRCWQPLAGQMEPTRPEAFHPLQHRPHHHHHHLGTGLSKKAGGPPPLSYRHYSQALLGSREEALRREKRPKKPGKHICQYCGRACAKPSVLKKHIRSHTGERPYPCVPCGFSFKTKSNLYKHRKSHAHAIKAGLVSVAEAEAACRSDTEPAAIGEEAELPSEGDESTDTDEEIGINKSLSLGMAPESDIAEDGKVIPCYSPKAERRMLSKSSQKYSSDSDVFSEEPSAGPMKVPILIVPKGGIKTPTESPPFIKTEPSQSPGVVWKYGGPHTIKQRLALRLSEKRGQDSEQSLNLLSPHSKGSTDSGYFSRSESAEQQVSPPNTNVKSYAEIIFGKFARLAPRSLAVGMVTQEPPLMAFKEKGSSATMADTKPDIDKFIEERIIQLITHNEVLIDPRQLNTPRKFSLYRGDSTDFQKHQMLMGHPGSDVNTYCGDSLNVNVGESFISAGKEHLGVPSDMADSAPLIRSNSMPISSGNGLSVPQVLRGSHSFDERFAGSDDVFHSGSGLSHQRMLKRQTAIELFSGLEGHPPPGCTSDDSEQGHGLLKGPHLVTAKLEEGETGEGDFSPLVRKAQQGRGSVYECEICGIKYQIWDNLEAHRKFYCSQPHGPRMKTTIPKPAGESGLEYGPHAQPMHYKTGQGLENLPFRKRRKEKSVGDEEDLPSNYSSPYSGSTTSLASVGDCKTECASLDQEPVSRTVSVSTMTASSFHGSLRDSGGSMMEFRRKVEDKETHGSEEALSSAEAWPNSPQGKQAVDASRRVTGNEISVIQHTNSLSRPSSFERSESMELIPAQHSGPCDIPAASEPSQGLGGRQAEGGEQQAGPLPPQPQVPPKLVRQHNIQVPEIRVTEEPDKPEKEQEVPMKEPDKSGEEFQWPQRSETLSQLPAEKLPPKKKRLRLADLEYSSGESSLESSTLSRSPSQESNWSHSSSFSLSLEREESLKPMAAAKVEDFSKAAEYLTVPYGVSSLGLLNQQQKEMRRSASEQAPCQPYMEMAEIRSKSFDYGNLSGGPGAAAPIRASSPIVKERRKCFLVRQASLSQYSETPQLEHGQELAEPMQIGQGCPVGARGLHHHSRSPVLPDDGRNVVCSSPTCQLPSDTVHQPDLHQPWQLYHHHQQPLPYFLAQPPSEISIPGPPGAAEPASSDLYVSQRVVIPQPYPQVPPGIPLHPANSSEAFPAHQPGPPAERRLQSRAGSREKDQPPTSPRASPQHSPNRRAKFQPDRSGGSASVPAPRVPEVIVSPGSGAMQPSPSLLVPVRIQANVPTYGSVMYTSVSHVQGTRPPTGNNAIVICKVEDHLPKGTLVSTTAVQGMGQELAHVLSAQRRGLLQYPQWKLPPSMTGKIEVSLPLSLNLVSTDNSSSIGGSKRMLSPASSLELFTETKQQKRIKEEKICGQMLEKLSLQESNVSTATMAQNVPKPAKPQLVRQFCTTELKEGCSSPLSSSSSSSSSSQRYSIQTLESIPSEERLFPSHCSDMESVDGESSQRAPPSPGESASESQTQQIQKFPISMLVQVPASQGGTVVGGTILLSDVADLQQFLQFPSLRTSTSVSWCFLNYTKPNHAQHTAPKLSMYATWCISSYNPNPPGTATKIALALLRSKQKASREIYIMSAVNWPRSGKLVASSSWKQRLAQIKWYESSQCESDGAGRKTAGSFEKEREKMETGINKDHSCKQVEPSRIKIFDGGFKSNEDYVYVRGRGRGKYICEECGIRCKKPSMLKKHIRTHTDLRPFMCKFCNFAFKTKGNLTKHMKSKAHTKKCLELGIAVTCAYSTDTEEAGITDEIDKDALSEIPVRHQFSDPEESDGVEEEGDEDDDDEDDDDEDRQGDSTATTRSRSTSPLPHSSKASSVTFSIASPSAFDVSHSNNQSSLISYLVTLPRIQVTQLVPPSYSHAGTPLTDYQRSLHNRLPESVEYKDRLDIPTSTNVWLPRTDDASPKDDSSREMSPSGDTGSSAQPSPGYDSSPGRDASPTSQRYLSPRGDLSPRRHLSPRREISPIRHRSPKRETYLSEISPRRDASPRRHFLPRREIPSPRQLSPVKDLSPRRELSPRRDYRERRHMPLMRATSPRRGSFQSGYMTGQYMQHADMSLRQSHLNSYDNSRMVPWPSYPARETPPGEQDRPSLSEGQQSCLFSHLPLHSQQQVRAPYQMIPIGGIQMVHSGAMAFPGLLPASQLPLQVKQREKSIIDEATHCVIESIKEMDIFSKSEDVQMASPMAVSPPRPTSPTDPFGMAPSGAEGSRTTGGEAYARAVEGQQEHRTFPPRPEMNPAATRALIAQSRLDEAMKSFDCQRRLESNASRQGAPEGPGAEHFSGPQPTRPEDHRLPGFGHQG